MHLLFAGLRFPEKVQLFEHDERFNFEMSRAEQPHVDSPSAYLPTSPKETLLLPSAS